MPATRSTVAASATRALELLGQAPADVVVTDLRMPGDLDGLGLLQAIKQRGLDSEVILVTAFATADTAIAAMKQGAYDYLTKPFKVDEINAVIGRVIEKRALVGRERGPARAGRRPGPPRPAVRHGRARCSGSSS